MFWVTQEITGAADYWTAGHTGHGVDVAIIDTGVNPVKGLNAGGQLVYGPDLSFESQNKEYAFSDTFGHGTHLAGIIAGRDGDPATFGDDDGRFMGMAPDSRLVSVKVGTHDGAVDVSQVIAAIDWVIEHRTDNGLNIRVLNLAYGTDSTQSWRIDPLSYAVERAWKAGIVVVVSAGNDGNSSGLRNPATNRHVIAVGASESNMTYDASDDQLTGFSNCGASWFRPVDVVAPGKSIVSLRSPGSSADVDHPRGAGRRPLLPRLGYQPGRRGRVRCRRPHHRPASRHHSRRGQSAPHRAPPSHSPAFCTAVREQVSSTSRTAIDTSTPTPRRIWATAQGTGSLEAARGSVHIQLDGRVLEGEQDIFGQPWDANRWVKASQNDDHLVRRRMERLAVDLGRLVRTVVVAVCPGPDSRGQDSPGPDSRGQDSPGPDSRGHGLSLVRLSWSGLSWSGLSWSAETWN